MRQVAAFAYIKELLDGVYEQKEGWEPNILHCARGKLSRVNIVGVLLREGSQLLLDDGSGQISIRLFDEIPGADSPTGSVVQVIGRPREYQDSLYVVAEIIKPLSAEWVEVRKTQLGSVQDFEKPEIVKKPSSEQKAQPVDNKAEHLISIITGLDEGEGAFVEDVLEESELGEVAEQILNQLLLDGEVFEVKPGIVKVL